VFSEEEQDLEWLRKNWFAKLKDDKKEQLAEGLYSHYKVIVLAELNMPTTSSSVMKSFADLVGTLNSDATGKHLPPVRIESNGAGHKAVRDASREELINTILSNESSRRWSANNKERESLAKLAEEEAARRLRETASGRDQFTDMPGE
jgi:hypothetical protein